MNDLLTPLLYVCMTPYCTDVLKADVALFDIKILMDIEADSYW